MTMAEIEKEHDNYYMLFIRYCQTGRHPGLASIKHKGKTLPDIKKQKRISDYFKRIDHDEH